MTTTTLPVQQRRSGPSLVFPIVLISIGVALLLVNTGYLTNINWRTLLALWPVLLVLAGVDILLRPRSFYAAAVVEIAIVLAALVYLISGATLVPVATGSYTIDVPRAGITDLGLTVNYGAGELALHGGGSSLVSVSSTMDDVTKTVDQNGSSATVVISGPEGAWSWTGGTRRWDMQIPNDVRTALTLNVGAGSFDVDLSNVQLTRATLNGGASSLAVRLGTPKGDVPVKIASGMSSLDLRIPDGMAYRVTYSGVMQSTSGPLSSSNYDSATDRFTIRIDSAMGSVTVHH